MNSIHSAGGILALRSEERLAFLIRMYLMFSLIISSVIDLQEPTTSHIGMRTYYLF